MPFSPPQAIKYSASQRQRWFRSLPPNTQHYAALVKTAASFNPNIALCILAQSTTFGHPELPGPPAPGGGPIPCSKIAGACRIFGRSSKLRAFWACSKAFARFDQCPHQQREQHSSISVLLRHSQVLHHREVSDDIKVFARKFDVPGDIANPSLEGDTLTFSDVKDEAG
ncbi:hypothetical protein BKA70DRAFT_1447152 [Coprinopsis sp. MPI-PUGE-AT-0042]|nr:hypothetical protein BKA70DRAFT_1447152 [Coprinopsis sp. MPI-PUGE-AT-0042]